MFPQPPPTPHPGRSPTPALRQSRLRFKHEVYTWIRLPRSLHFQSEKRNIIGMISSRYQACILKDRCCGDHVKIGKRRRIFCLAKQARSRRTQKSTLALRITCGQYSLVAAFILVHRNINTGMQINLLLSMGRSLDVIGTVNSFAATSPEPGISGDLGKEW